MRASNPYLKKANEVCEYTPDQIAEIARCAVDPVYFIKKYVQIQHPVKGSLPFKLYNYQVNMINTYHNNRLSIVLSPRQTGKSWSCGAYMLWFAMFNDEKTVLIASNKNDNAKEMVSRIRFMYERVPHWLKAGLTEDGWNKHAVGFDNGSRIISQATSADTGRGLAISLLFLDEFAFVRDSVQEEFWTSISPTLATGGSCIICSTPNGDTNRFAQLWRGANAGISALDEAAEEGENAYFVPVEVAWNDPPGRDEKFKRAEIRKIGETKWKQEYECKFLSSDPLLIDTVCLERIGIEIEKVRPYGHMGEVTFYKDVVPGGTYLIGSDPATGSGKDVSSIEVFEFPSMIQVAEWRSNTSSSNIMYHMLKRIISVFEKQRCIIYFSLENNGVGEGLVSLYEEDQYPPPTAMMISETGGSRIGFTTTKSSKPRDCMRLKDLIENGSISIRSKFLLSEFKNFVRSGGTYAAKRGSTDDSISALLIVLRIVDEMTEFEQEAYNMMKKTSPVDPSEAVIVEYDESNYLDQPMPYI